MNFFQTGIIIFQMIVYPILTKDISANFGKSSPQERFKEPVYLMINQSNWDSPAKVNIHFADEFNYVIFYVSVYYDTDNYDFNTKAALYWTGFKKMKPDSDEMVFDSQRLIHCSAIMHTTCSIQSPWCYAKENLNDLISIEMKASSKFNSIMNATFIPAKRTSKPGRCENGMKSHNCGNNVTVCPVTFTKEFVPLIGNDSSILSSIGSDLKYPRENTKNAQIIPAVLIPMLILVIAGIVLVILWQKGILKIKAERSTNPEEVSLIEVREDRTELKHENSIIKYREGKTIIHVVKKQEITIMLVGMKGHGKRTLIDALVNYLFQSKNLSLNTILKEDEVDSYIVHCQQEDEATVLNIVNIPSFTDNYEHDIEQIHQINNYQLEKEPDFLCFVSEFQSIDQIRDSIFFKKIDTIKNVCPRMLIFTKLDADSFKETEIQNEFINRQIIASNEYCMKIETSYFSETDNRDDHDYKKSINTMKHLFSVFFEKKISLMQKVIKEKKGTKNEKVLKLGASDSHVNVEELSCTTRCLSVSKKVSIVFAGFEKAGKKTLIKGLIEFILSRKSEEEYKTEVEDNMMKIIIPAMTGSRVSFNMEIWNIPSFKADMARNQEETITSYRKGLPKSIDAFCFLVKPNEDNSAILDTVSYLCDAFEFTNIYIVSTFNDGKFITFLKNKFEKKYKIEQISTRVNVKNKESLPFEEEDLLKFLKNLSELQI